MWDMAQRIDGIIFTATEFPVKWYKKFRIIFQRSICRNLIFWYNHKMHTELDLRRRIFEESNQEVKTCWQLGFHTTSLI